MWYILVSKKLTAWVGLGLLKEGESSKGRLED